MGDCVAIARVRNSVRANIAPLAVLLQPVQAALALAAGIHEAANANAVTRSEILHSSTHPRYPADDLMARNQRIWWQTPFATCRMNIGVAKTAKLDRDLHIVFLGRTARDSKRYQPTVRRGRTKSRRERGPFRIR
ncbi:hypothetical protein NtRootA1_33100 [Arthrobacter sp. NtRootA1]|nr:hypothetical protein NtRootA1_33100 [Arthrobacter sp. NtRootA1]